LFIFTSQNFWCQRHNLHELFIAKFTCHWAKNTGTDGFEFCIQQNGCVAIKLDQRTIRAANTLGCANNYSIVDFAFLDTTAWGRIFNGYFDDVTNGRLAAFGTTKNLDAHYRTRTRVIGHI